MEKPRMVRGYTPSPFVEKGEWEKGQTLFQLRLFTNEMSRIMRKYQITPRDLQEYYDAAKVVVTIDLELFKDIDELWSDYQRILADMGQLEKKSEKVTYRLKKLEE